MATNNNSNNNHISYVNTINSMNHGGVINNNNNNNTTNRTPQPGFLMPLTSLYVGDLHPDVTEALLYEKFSPAGQILSLRVCRDARTKQSLGYSYINFSSSEDAERILDTMNFDLLKGKPIRIMWSQRDPALRKSGVGNVFIKNLDKTIDNKAMYDTFSAFGNILSCKIAMDDDGISKGYGFVHFDNIGGAKKAIEKVNGMLLNGKKVYVGKFIPRNEREKMLGEKKKYTNLYVKNFKSSMTEERLCNIFKQFGNITSCAIMRNIDGSSKCFGFVSFDDSLSAEKAVSEMNNANIDGENLYVGRAQKKTERALVLKRTFEQMRLDLYNRVQGANLYIKNLDDTFDNEKLQREFSPYGTITSAKVMTEGGRSKGFGFVCFSSADEATKAIQEMDGRMVGSKPIYVGLAQRYEDRRAYLASQCMQRLRYQMSLSSTPFYIPNYTQVPRIINHLNQVRPTSRWTNPPLQRLNGTFNLPMAPPPPPIFRSISRQMINPNRNNIYSRPMNNHQQITQRGLYNKTKTQTQTPTPLTPPPPSPSPSAWENPILGQQNVVQSVQASSNSQISKAGNGDASSNDKEVIGEKMYRVVEKFYPDIAGKITGMLLEIDISELKNLLNNQESLKAKVEEAVAVLQAHQAKTGLAVMQE